LQVTASMLVDGPLSAKACVAALVRSGFTIVSVNGATVLERGGRVVLVPGVRLLQPEVVRVIARAAGVTMAELDAALQAVRRASVDHEDREVESRS
jgi:hypothetical protein